MSKVKPMLSYTSSDNVTGNLNHIDGRCKAKKNHATLDTKVISTGHGLQYQTIHGVNLYNSTDFTLAQRFSKFTGIPLNKLLV